MTIFDPRRTNSPTSSPRETQPTAPRALILGLLLLAAVAKPSPAQYRAYVTNLLGNDISVVDLANGPGSVIGTIPAGANPAGLAFERHGRFLYVGNLNDNTVQVIDTQASPPAIVETLTVEAGPTGFVASPVADRVYVSNFDANSISVIDSGASPPVVLHTVPIGELPDGLAISPDGTRLYLAEAEDHEGSFSRVQVIDLTQSPPAAVDSLLIDPEPHGLVLTPQNQLVVSSSDLDTATLIDAETLAVLDTLDLPLLSAYAIAATSNGSHVYFTDVDGPTVFEVAITDNSLVPGPSVDIGSASVGIAVIPNTRKVVVTAAETNQLHVIDFALDPPSIVDSIPVGELPISYGFFLAEVPPGFANGFEEGNLSAWSQVVP